MKAGDRFLLQTAGGGGYGDPLERDREAVLQDVAENYVSQDAAAKLYGREI
jgi:N-methylhydantoinase B